jgi:O-succinylbenzoate synthase
VRLSADPLEAAAAGAADVMVLKVQPLGGVHRALDLARRAGLPVVVSSALETSVGLAGGVHLAACLDRLDYACGLGTVTLLEGDVTASPLVPVGGFVEVRRPEPDPGLLDRWQADRATELRLMRRLREAAELLT